MQKTWRSESQMAPQEAMSPSLIMCLRLSSAAGDLVAKLRTRRPLALWLHFVRMRYYLIPLRDRLRTRLDVNFRRARVSHAAKASSRSASARKPSLVGRPAKASSISARNTTSCNALRLSLCKGRRGLASQGLARRACAVERCR